MIRDAHRGALISVCQTCNEQMSDSQTGLFEEIFEKVKNIEVKLDRLIASTESVSHGTQLDSSGNRTKNKRTRAKSAYNLHMSKKLAELKESHPNVGHRERFAMAVTSWSHLTSENVRIDAPDQL